MMTRFLNITLLVRQYERAITGTEERMAPCEE